MACSDVLLNMMVLLNDKPTPKPSPLAEVRRATDVLEYTFSGLIYGRPCLARSRKLSTTASVRLPRMS